MSHALGDLGVPAFDSAEILDKDVLAERCVAVHQRRPVVKGLLDLPSHSTRGQVAPRRTSAERQVARGGNACAASPSATGAAASMPCAPAGPPCTLAERCATADTVTHLVMKDLRVALYFGAGVVRVVELKATTQHAVARSIGRRVMRGEAGWRVASQEDVRRSTRAVAAGSNARTRVWRRCVAGARVGSSRHRTHSWRRCSARVCGSGERRRRQRFCPTRRAPDRAQ